MRYTSWLTFCSISINDIEQTDSDNSNLLRDSFHYSVLRTCQTRICKKLQQLRKHTLTRIEIYFALSNKVQNKFQFKSKNQRTIIFICILTIRDTSQTNLYVGDIGDSSYIKNSFI